MPPTMPENEPTCHERGCRQHDASAQQAARRERAAGGSRLTLVCWSLMRSNLTTFKAAIKTSMRCMRPALLGVPTCSQPGAVAIAFSNQQDTSHRACRGQHRRAPASIPRLGSCLARERVVELGRAAHTSKHTQARRTASRMREAPNVTNGPLWQSVEAESARPA